MNHLLINVRKTKEMNHLLINVRKTKEMNHLLINVRKTKEMNHLLINAGKTKEMNHLLINVRKTKEMNHLLINAGKTKEMNHLLINVGRTKEMNHLLINAGKTKEMNHLLINGWDLDCITGAKTQGEGCRFELEPMNELLIGHNVSLSSVVRSAEKDASIWYAQDAMGAIWKLDLSFTHTTPDPECVLQFHCGAIQGLDVSCYSLMASTALDRSVKVFDFLSNKELTSFHFNTRGTTLCWAPPQVEQGRGLLVVGFDDGVVRLLDVYDPQRLHAVPAVLGQSHKGAAELRLRQALKAHSQRVTCVAFSCEGDLLTTACASECLCE
uniref:Uncharacterized protein n=1 Tax=Knipowitschia caucasica TaxID=637954 RepID=A0AAV2IT09_KNICA